MRWTIRAKLSALVLAVLLPLVAGAVLKFSRDLGEGRAGAQAQLFQTSHVVARHLDEVLSGQFEKLEVLTSVRSLERLQDAVTKPSGVVVRKR